MVAYLVALDAADGPDRLMALRSAAAGADGWRAVIDQPGALILLRGEAPVRTLPAERGWVIGDLYREGRPVGSEPPSVRISQNLPACDVASDLCEHFWGRYVAVIRETGAAGTQVFRDPSGALEADFDEEVLPLLARMEANGTVIETVHRGDILQWAEGKLTVLFPPEGFSASNANDGSMALLVEAEGVKLLLTGDLSARYGQYAAVSADVVKAAHHGSKNGTTQAFLDESAPTAVLVSTQRANAADYLRGITDADVYSTLESGAIIIRMADSCFTIEQFEEMQ